MLYCVQSKKGVMLKELEARKETQKLGNFRVDEEGFTGVSDVTGERVEVKEIVYRGSTGDVWATFMEDGEEKVVLQKEGMNSRYTEEEKARLAQNREW